MPWIYLCPLPAGEGIPLTDAKKRPDAPDLGSFDLSWDSLPAVAKERWEEAVAFGSTVELQLIKARTDRSQAEMERQKVAQEILEATKDACREIVANAKQTLAKAKHHLQDAERKSWEAQRESEQAIAIRKEAQRFKEKLVVETEDQAHEMLRKAKIDAESEYRELKAQAANEVQRVMAQAEALRAAAREELETQRVFSEAAMFKTEARNAIISFKSGLGEQWEQLEAMLNEAPTAPEPQPEQSPEQSMEDLSEDPPLIVAHADSGEPVQAAASGNGIKPVTGRRAKRH